MFLSCPLQPAQPLLSCEFKAEQDESTSLQCTLQCKLALLHPNVRSLIQLEMPSLSPWGGNLHSTLMLLLTGCQELFPGPSLALSLTPGQSGQKCVASGRWPQASSQTPSTGLEQGARQQKINYFQTGIREKCQDDCSPSCPPQGTNTPWHVAATCTLIKSISGKNQ